MSQFEYILDFIDQLRLAATPADVCGRLLSFIVGLGPATAMLEEASRQRSPWPGGWLKRHVARGSFDRAPATDRTKWRQVPARSREASRSIGAGRPVGEDDANDTGPPDDVALPPAGFDRQTVTVSLGAEAVGLSATEFDLVSLAATCAIGRAMQLQSEQARQVDRADLTPRERECLQWAATGKSEWEISQILGISEHTSEKHLLNAKTKLGAVNRVQAVAEAIRRGYIR
jgi:LuxR family quorum sensing-dependent transcriptional regulator